MKTTLTGIDALLAEVACCGAALRGDEHPDPRSANPIPRGDVNRNRQWALASAHCGTQTAKT